MTSMMNWNVRVLDYLTERGVDPMIKDKYGFTALRKAQIKNLRTISSMLQAYETKYEAAKADKKSSINPITSEEWEKRLSGVDLNKYKVFTVMDKDNKTWSQYKPSDLLCIGEYPFSNLEDNQLVIAVTGNYFYYQSPDEKMIP